MKKLLLPFLFFISAAFCNAQTPFYHYSYGMGYSNGDAAFGHALDAATGEIYIAASFNGGSVIDLDPGPGTFTVSGTSYARPALIKLTPNGQFIWGVKLAAGGSDITAERVATDASGNIYVAGMFSGTATDFDPGPGTFTLASNSTLGDVYISKYNSSGAWQWTIGFGGNSNGTKAYDIKVSAAGNVYVCGDLEGTGCDFDPSAGTAIMNPSGQRDGYVAKYNTNGQYQWAFLTGSNLFCSWNSMMLDASENIYVTGNFEGTNIDMDPGAGTSYLSAPTTNYDLFVAKYNSSKQLQWAFKLGNATNTDTWGSVASDQSGNIFVTGSFNGSFDADPGAGSAILSGAGGAGFIAKYSSAGAYLSSATIPRVEYIYANNDANGNVYVTGSFTATADFDPGAGVASLANSGGVEDIFVAKYNSSLAYQWAFAVGGNDFDYSRWIEVDNNTQNVTISGMYSSTTLDFDPGTGTSNATNNGSNDLFFARYSQSPDIGVKEINKGLNLSVIPNPNNGVFFIQADQEKKLSVTIYNSLGQLVVSMANIRNNDRIDLSQYGAGIYTIVVNSATERKTVKIVVE